MWREAKAAIAQAQADHVPAIDLQQRSVTLHNTLTDARTTATTQARSARSSATTTRTSNPSATRTRDTVARALRGKDISLALRFGVGCGRCARRGGARRARKIAPCSGSSSLGPARPVNRAGPALPRTPTRWGRCAVRRPRGSRRRRFASVDTRVYAWPMGRAGAGRLLTEATDRVLHRSLAFCSLAQERMLNVREGLHDLACQRSSGKADRTAPGRNQRPSRRQGHSCRHTDAPARCATRYLSTPPAAAAGTP
ncbi:hypothetical protein DFJ66_7759 [Saccharothrix variisporea]|uniref:Uncharacterized protein n=1 Tax=Saccharothrix variisporea TaxID=543527 RepID=A0A495XMH7_9PSEU|nr:hypothetical protein DFJ66_7759 [Saccharothrix variisporea]